MKILYVITGLAVGGAEKALLDLSKEALSHGDDVAIVSLTPVCRDFASRFDNEIEIIEVNLRGFTTKWNSLFEFKKVVRGFNPDLIHAHMVHANIFVLACKAVGIVSKPIVITAHSVNEGFFANFYRLFTRFADHCIHISNPGLIYYRERYFFPSKKSSYVANGTAVFPRSRDVQNLGNPIRFVSVGRIAKEKNFGFMLDAMEQLKFSEASFKLAIIGDGSQRGEIERLISQKKLNDCVKLEGFTDDVRVRLEKSDFFLMSSDYEGMPMALLEACEVGLPSLVTDVGSCKEVIDGLPNCYVVPVNDLEQYISCLKKLVIITAQDYCSSTLIIRQRALEKYSVNAAFAELRKIYLKAIYVS